MLEYKCQEAGIECTVIEQDAEIQIGKDLKKAKQQIRKEKRQLKEELHV